MSKMKKIKYIHTRTFYYKQKLDNAHNNVQWARNKRYETLITLIIRTASPKIIIITIINAYMTEMKLYIPMYA